MLRTALPRLGGFYLALLFFIALKWSLIAFIATNTVQIGPLSPKLLILLTQGTSVAVLTGIGLRAILKVTQSPLGVVLALGALQRRAKLPPSLRLAKLPLWYKAILFAFAALALILGVCAYTIYKLA